MSKKYKNKNIIYIIILLLLIIFFTFRKTYIREYSISTSELTSSFNSGSGSDTQSNLHATASDITTEISGNISQSDCSCPKDSSYDKYQNANRDDAQKEVTNSANSINDNIMNNHSSNLHDHKGSDAVSSDFILGAMQKL